MVHVSITMDHTYAIVKMVGRDSIVKMVFTKTWIALTIIPIHIDVNFMSHNHNNSFSTTDALIYFFFYKDKKGFCYGLYFLLILYVDKGFCISMICWYSLMKPQYFLDVNECNQYPCKNNGTCINNDGSYFCNCIKGFENQDCLDGKCFY